VPTRAKVAVMNVALRKPWTQDQFFVWAEAQDTRYEFDGFQPVAMTGGTAGHYLITYNLRRALDRQLGRGACRPLGPNAGVQTVGTTVRYPDGLVTCSKYSSSDRVIPGVVVIFKVVSPGSGYMDRIVKLEEYAAVPTIRRYVILESTSVAATVHQRDTPDQVWHTTPLKKDSVLQMPELGIEIPVSTNSTKTSPFPKKSRPPADLCCLM
jgi:Uma2 family endonuclease